MVVTGSCHMTGLGPRWTRKLQPPLPPQVALVFPNNDPVAFMVAFYGCLLAEVVPVPIEVPLSRKVLPLRPPSGFQSYVR